MNMKLLSFIFTVFLSFLHGPVLVAAEDSADEQKEEKVQTDLEILIENSNPEYAEVLLRYLIGTGATMDSLIEDFKVSTKEKRPTNFLKAKNSKIVALKKRIAELVREFKRDRSKIPTERPERPAKFNKFFYGNWELAEDADENQTLFYRTVLDVIGELILDEQERFPGLHTGDLETFLDCLHLIDDLFHYHTHNRQIGREAYFTGEAPTYENLKPERNREAIHWDKDSASDPHVYETRVLLILTTFERAYTFAVANDLLKDMLHFLSMSKGCLEARINTLNKWWEAKEQIFARRRNSSGSELTNTLKETAEEAVNAFIRENYGDMGLYDAEEDGKRIVVDKVLVFFEGKVDCEGRRITKEMVRHCLAMVFRSPFSTPDKKVTAKQISPKTPPSPSKLRSKVLRPSPKATLGQSSTSGTSSLNPAVRRLLFSEPEFVADSSESEEIEELAAIVMTIRRIVHFDGTIGMDAQLVRAIANGNCGLEALGTTREIFIAAVARVYRDPNTDIALRRLIDHAIANLRLPEGAIDAWADAFNNPRIWMEDFHFEIYALIFNMRIEIYGVDRENTEFYGLNVFGPETASVTQRIVNRTLVRTATTENRPLNGNHYDRLVLLNHGEGVMTEDPALVMPPSNLATQVLGLIVGAAVMHISKHPRDKY